MEVRRKKAASTPFDTPQQQPPPPPAVPPIAAEEADVEDVDGLPQKREDIKATEADPTLLSDDQTIADNAPAPVEPEAASLENLIDRLVEDSHAEETPAPPPEEPDFLPEPTPEPD